MAAQGPSLSQMAGQPHGAQLPGQPGSDAAVLMQRVQAAEEQAQVVLVSCPLHVAATDAGSPAAFSTLPGTAVSHLDPTASLCCTPPSQQRLQDAAHASLPGQQAAGMEGTEAVRLLSAELAALADVTRLLSTRWGVRHGMSVAQRWPGRHPASCMPHA